MPWVIPALEAAITAAEFTVGFTLGTKVLSAAQNALKSESNTREGAQTDPREQDKSSEDSSPSKNDNSCGDGPKGGSSGGPGEGKKFPKSVKNEASKEKCVFCGKKTTKEPGPQQRNIDHAQPRSRGGNNTLDNAQNTCRTCNLQKGAQTTQEFLSK
ncbi:MAG: HNH endonuclease [Nitrospirales bacterium]|nr:HNH endonuclease [Nitrospirales bacterium]